MNKDLSIMKKYAVKNYMGFYNSFFRSYHKTLKGASQFHSKDEAEEIAKKINGGEVVEVPKRYFL